MPDDPKKGETPSLPRMQKKGPRSKRFYEDNEDAFEVVKKVKKRKKPKASK